MEERLQLQILTSAQSLATPMSLGRSYSQFKHDPNVAAVGPQRSNTHSRDKIGTRALLLISNVICLSLFYLVHLEMQEHFSIISYIIPAFSPWDTWLMLRDPLE